MVFVRLAYFPAGTAAHYGRLARLIGDSYRPEHRYFFAAGPVPGGWQVVQAWRSREDLDRFNAEVYLPALARTGGSVFPAPPQVVDLDATDVDLRPLGADPSAAPTAAEPAAPGGGAP